MLEQDWQWADWQGLSYLTCNLFKDWQHGFFTKQFEGILPSDLVKIFDSEAEAYRLTQIHSDLILTPSQINTNFNHEGDAIITESPNQSVWVASADCTPVLIADILTGRVAAIHAGWRGTSQNIVVKTIDQFLELGSDVNNLIFALGPAISGKVYQVDEDLAIAICETIFEKKEILSKLIALKNSPILEDEIKGKVKLDVRRVITLQLEKKGIKNEQITVCPYCTYQESDRFFSYRRTHQKQIQWSGIISHFVK